MEIIKNSGFDVSTSRNENNEAVFTVLSTLTSIYTDLETAKQTVLKCLKDERVMVPIQSSNLLSQRVRINFLSLHWWVKCSKVAEKYIYREPQVVKSIKLKMICIHASSSPGANFTATVYHDAS